MYIKTLCYVYSLLLIGLDLLILSDSQIYAVA